jgi:hypothetical protein
LETFELPFYVIPAAPLSAVSEVAFIKQFGLQVWLGDDGKRYFYDKTGVRATASPRPGFPKCLTFFDEHVAPGPTPSVLTLDMAFFAIPEVQKLS